MKIVQLITGAADFGGAQAHVRDLALGLRSHGHDCMVLTSLPECLFTEQLRTLGIPVQLLTGLRRSPHPMNDLRALTELLRVLRQLKPDLIAAHTAKAGFLGRLAGAMLKIPCVFTPHGWSVVDRLTGRVNRTYRTLERLAGMIGPGVITVSQAEKDLGRTSGIVPPKKLFCVHNGITDCDLLASPGDDHLTVVMVARFHKQKDHATLFRAMARLRAYPWRLILLGAGPLMGSMQEMARSLGLEDRMDFPGEVPNATAILAQSTVFALSSSFEAFPISVLEAMRAGLPVVASSVGGIPEAVSHGETGFLVPPFRDDLLAASLEALFLDPALRKRLGRNGRDVFLDRFTDERMVLRTLEVYGTVLQQDLNPRVREDSSVLTHVGS